MPVYIRDDDVRTMAQRLAEARGTTVTAAVREALRRELAGRALFANWADDPPAAPWLEADRDDADGAPR